MRYGPFIAVLVVALGAALTGCRGAPPLTESIKNDRVGSLKRSVELAMRSQSTAADDLLESVDRAASAEVAAMHPSLAYDTTRRMLSRSQSRYRSTVQSLDKAEIAAEEVFGQWRKEVRRYADAGVRAQAEEGLRARRAEFNAALEEIRNAAKAVPPVQQELGDRTLYFKHARDEGASAGPPAFTADGLARMESARRELRERTARARTTVGELVADGAWADGTAWAPSGESPERR